MYNIVSGSSWRSRNPGVVGRAQRYNSGGRLALTLFLGRQYDSLSSSVLNCRRRKRRGTCTLTVPLAAMINLKKISYFASSTTD
jgi:hypothetical protein